MATHPKFPSLQVIVGGKAKAGAFYVPQSGKTLSYVAADAYGNGKLANTLKINKSAWNMANCVYRATSTSCSSKKVPGVQAAHQKTWDAGAWISFCNIDKNATALQLGMPYQVLWVPTATGQEPGDLAPEISSPVLKVPDLNKVPTLVNPVGPIQVTPVEPDPVTAEPAPVEQKAGFPWWFGLGVGLLAIGGMIVVTSKTKKGKA